LTHGSGGDYSSPVALNLASPPALDRRKAMNAHAVRTFLQKQNLVPAIVVLLFSFVTFFAVASSIAQSPAKEEREIEDRIPQHLPIKVKVKNPEKVKDLKNDHWLGDLEIEVKNTGDKPIYFLRLGLIFVDVKKDSGEEIGYSLNYGRGKLIDLRNLAEPDDVPIPSGGTYVFKLHESYVKGWNWYRTKVEKKPQPKKISIIFSVINFGDGTGFVTSGGEPVPKRGLLRE
jgi:hypothetical protein